MLRLLSLTTCVAAYSASVDVDVLIVGAGQAGMAAAHELVALGHTVQVLEATDHVGGRTRNYDTQSNSMDVATDDVVEVGGTWFSPEHTAALALAQKLGIEVYNASFVNSSEMTSLEAPQGPEEEDFPWWFWGSDYPKAQMHLLKDTVFNGAQGIFRFRSPADFRERASHLQEEFKSVDQIVKAATDSISDKCWNATEVLPAWRHLDTDSTGGSLGGQLHSTEARQVLRNCIHTHNAAEPEAVSFLYNSISFKGCNSGGPDNQFRVRGGTQAIPLAIAAQLHDRIMLEAPVRSMRSLAPRPGVVAQLDDGREFSARYAIVTGPPPAVLGIKFEPTLSGVQDQLLQRMPMGTSLKYGAIYKEGPWWRELGFQGDILSTSLPVDLSLPGGEIPLFVQCVDHSPFSRRVGVIMCFVEGRQNLYFTTLPPEKQGSLMAEFLQRSFNDSRAVSLKPTFVSHNWADQAYARGAYTSFFPPGVMSVPEYWAAYRNMEKVPNIFLAGADYHTGFGNGYIEGAIRSGQRAADLVHERLQSLHPDKPAVVV